MPARVRIPENPEGANTHMNKTDDEQKTINLPNFSTLGTPNSKLPTPI